MLENPSITPTISTRIMLCPVSRKEGWCVMLWVPMRAPSRPSCSIIHDQQKEAPSPIKTSICTQVSSSSGRACIAVMLLDTMRAPFSSLPFSFDGRLAHCRPRYNHRPDKGLIRVDQDRMWKSQIDPLPTRSTFTEKKL